MRTWNSKQQWRAITVTASGQAFIMKKISRLNAHTHIL